MFVDQYIHFIVFFPSANLKHLIKEEQKSALILWTSIFIIDNSAARVTYWAQSEKAWLISRNSIVCSVHIYSHLIDLSHGVSIIASRMWFAMYSNIKCLKHKDNEFIWGREKNTCSSIHWESIKLLSNVVTHISDAILKYLYLMLYGWKGRDGRSLWANQNDSMKQQQQPNIEWTILCARHILLKQFTAFCHILIKYRDTGYGTCSACIYMFCSLRLMLV